jgi:predicted ATP-grasp superfamily ATP-dependent carboligase
MAQGRDEHRMVFDIRGRRRHVVKAVYAILAVLMGASLFLVTGVLNPSTLFGTSSSSESATSSLEEQATRIEAKLAKTPEDEDMLLNLTRTRINVANTMITNGASGQSGLEEVKQQLALASEDWSKYLKAASEPSAGLAVQVSPALFQLAEFSTNGEEALVNVKAATEAQEIVAKARPSLNSLSTLGIYQAFAQEYKAASKSIEEATKFAGTKFERESLENKYEEVEKQAKEFNKGLKAEQAAASQSSSAGKEALENPLNSLGGTSSLGE